ncbi:MAG: hypothetical protein GWN32_01025 [Gemmatimonadetes bacterium]|nr:hypothetical protein [Gemmatimonadota bacterium]
MLPQNTPSVATIYRSDLERHLFAPAPRRRRRRTSRRNASPLADWLRNWFLAGRARWKQIAEAA